jgi:hypothetical protein
MWQGCSLPALLRLLWRNGLAVYPGYAYMPFVMATAGLIHLLGQALENVRYGDRPKRTTIRHPPVFIIGHWRTGTTLLHEFLSLDPQFSSPSTYACLCPHHFLISEPFADQLFWWMLPSRRPMDNMKTGWNRPQEDEFALCMLGQPSPYLTIAFPNHPPQDQQAFTLEQLPTRAREEWKRTFVTFLRRLTFRDPRRLVLKSPTHTWRIPLLLELFPKARFLHIVRNPYQVYLSTLKLWTALYQTHGLQRPTGQGLEENVLARLADCYARLEATRSLVPPGHLYELRYEDLIARPIEEMRAVYERLELGDFEAVRPRLEAYWAEQQGYQTNPYPALSNEQRQRITQACRSVLQRYGYGEA